MLSFTEFCYTTKKQERGKDRKWAPTTRSHNEQNSAQIRWQNPIKPGPKIAVCFCGRVVPCCRYLLVGTHPIFEKSQLKTWDAQAIALICLTLKSRCDTGWNGDSWRQQPISYKCIAPSKCCGKGPRRGPVHPPAVASFTHSQLQITMPRCMSGWGVPFYHW